MGFKTEEELKEERQKRQEDKKANAPVIQSIEDFYYQEFKPNQGDIINNYECSNSENTTEEEYQKLSAEKSYITGFLTFLPDSFLDEKLKEYIRNLKNNPNSMISYNEALFLLLRLNPLVLGVVALRVNIQDWGIVNIIRNDTKIKDPVAHILASTKENEKLLQCPNFSNSKISYKDFTTWAVDNGFIEKVTKVLPDNVAKQLYKLLLDKDLITGELNEKWQWKGQRNQLSYLAKQLKQKLILGDNCHKELSDYIQDPSPNSNKPLKNIEDPTQQKQTPINSIIEILQKG